MPNAIVEEHHRQLPLILGYRGFLGMGSETLEIGAGSENETALAKVWSMKGREFILAPYDELDTLPDGPLWGLWCQMEPLPNDAEGSQYVYKPLRRVAFTVQRLANGELGLADCHWREESLPTDLLTLAQGLKQQIGILERILPAEEGNLWRDSLALNDPVLLVERAGALGDLEGQAYLDFLAATTVTERYRVVQNHLEAMIKRDPVGRLYQKRQTVDLPPEVLERFEQKLYLWREGLLPEEERGMTVEWLDRVLQLPWQLPSPGSPLPPETAQSILDAQHSESKRVKQAVMDRVNSIWWRQQKAQQPLGQITPLLLVGPPGVGKTSILDSVAMALNRPLGVIGCGIIDDSQSLIGSDRLWVGADMGEIARQVMRAGTTNMVLAFDEIDKFGRNKGALWAAIMQLTDPVRSQHFVDRYFGFPLDLSHVFVVATANDLDAIPEPLLDRFEVLELRGYSMSEKMVITREHLWPKLLQKHQVEAQDVLLPELVLQDLLENYGDESGVRGLQQQLDTLLIRKLPELLQNGKAQITDRDLRQHLGNPLKAIKANAMHATPGSGDVLVVYGNGMGAVETLQVRLLPVENGSTVVTGQIKKQYRETINLTRDYVVAEAPALGISQEVANRLITQHLHVSHEGMAVSKDGPSGGVSLLLSMVGLLHGLLWPSDLVATGALEFDGKVAAVGGIAEKLTAAARVGKRRVIIPQENLTDLAEVAPDTLAKLQILPVSSALEAVSFAYPELGVQLEAAENEGYGID